MTLIQQVRQWLETLPGTAGFRWSYGPWTEQPGRVIALWQDGGRQVAAEDYPIVRVVLVGERDTRSDAVPLLELAAAIRDATVEPTCVGPSIRVTPVGGIVGPGFTAEGRAWVEINLEFLI